MLRIEVAPGPQIIGMVSQGVGVWWWDYHRTRRAGSLVFSYRNDHTTGSWYNLSAVEHVCLCNTVYVVLYSFPKGLGHLTIMVPRKLLYVRSNYLFGSRCWMIRFSTEILFKSVSFRPFSKKCDNADSEPLENVEEPDRQHQALFHRRNHGQVA